MVFSLNDSSMHSFHVSMLDTFLIDWDALTTTVAQDYIALVMLVDDFSVGKRLQILPGWVGTHH